MRFLPKNKINKTILVISDLHLGAGANFNGKQNFLEDFYHDRELVEFLEYYSKGGYERRPVELVINGDFLDFLAVPFVPYFDDEFWSEAAAIDKLKIILKAHSEVIKALGQFLSGRDKKIIYIIGNHDGEMIFKKAQDCFIQSLPETSRPNISFYMEGEYIPVEGVIIKHGHEYETAHDFDPKNSIIKSSDGIKYFIPPWGSYYVVRVVNKFKEERSYVNQVWPIQAFIIYGLIFDTLFTLRFLFAHIYYFLMVRFLDFYQSSKSLKEILGSVVKELELFYDSKTIARSFFQKNKVKALILGHTHRAIFHTFEEGQILINTGTWMKAVNLDFSSRLPEINLTYCQIEVGRKKKSPLDPFEHLDISLNVWKGKRELPYEPFS